MSILKKSLTMALVLAMLILTGCTGESTPTTTTAPANTEATATGETSGQTGDAAQTYTLGIVVASTYVGDDALKAFTDKLTANFPGVSVQSVSTGDTVNDPMGAMAGMTKLAGVMAAGECDLLITDLANAKRYSDNGESYVAIEKLFTSEELAAMNAAANPLPMTDDEGNETGDETAPCMLDFSANTELVSMLMFEPQICVMSNTEHIDTAKAVIAYLDGMSATGEAVG